MLEPGHLVGRYRIVRFLGAGAMGEVYLAEDPQIERALAIKTVRLAGRMQEVEDRKKRLLREARAAGRLLHPNIVTLFDAGEAEGILFLAFEYVEGSDLASRLEGERRLTLREVLRIGRYVAEALDYAHRQGIVHRDIKPSNILVDPAGRVKVADFGIAKVAGAATELTMSGSVMGSPQYLSPEQVRGEELDGRSDLFSLGVLLYEILAHKRPFEGETLTSLVYQILTREPPPIGELRAVPARLEALLGRMLAKDRDERIATAGDVAAELGAIELELAEETLMAPAGGDAIGPTTILPRRTTAATPPIAPPGSMPPGPIPPPPPPMLSGTGAPAAAAPPYSPTTRVTSRAVEGPPRPAAQPPEGGPVYVPGPGGVPPPPPAVPSFSGGPGPSPGSGGIPAVQPGSQAQPIPPPPFPGRGGAVSRSGGSGAARIWIALLVIAGLAGAGGLGGWYLWTHRPGWLPGGPAGSVQNTPGGTAGPENSSNGSTPPSQAAPPAGQVSSSNPAPGRDTAGSGTTAGGATSPPYLKTGQENASAGTKTPGSLGPSSSASAPHPASSHAPAGATGAPPPLRAGQRPIAPSTPLNAAPGAGRAPESSAPSAPAVPAPPTALPSAKDDRLPVTESPRPSPSPADRSLHSGLQAVFHVTPPDAIVVIDGRPLGRAEDWSGGKRGRIYIFPGADSYRVKLKKEGLRDVVLDVEVSETGGVTPIQVSMRPLPAAQADASDLETFRTSDAIALRVDPPSAVFSVDGQASAPVRRFVGAFGRATGWLTLAPGKHRISVSAPGYQTRDLMVDVTGSAERDQVAIPVKLLPGGGG
jgi:serine/threonine-protein kinase